MRLAEAKRVYIAAGGHDDHRESEWEAIRQEMAAVVAAPSDLAAGQVIRSWGSWTPRYTATAFARRVRLAAAGRHCATCTCERMSR